MSFTRHLMTRYAVGQHGLVLVLLRRPRGGAALPVSRGSQYPGTTLRLEGEPTLSTGGPCS